MNLSDVIDKKFDTSKSFPIDIFTPQINKLIQNSEKTIGYHPDYLSAGILSVCASAIGTSVNLFNGSYTSYPILWLAIIGREGIGKTHPLTFAKKPLEKKDKENYIEFQELFKDYEKQEKKGSKPNYIKSILTDFTPEKLAETLQHNENGVLIFKDELIGWINSFDQYKKGGDQQRYLELFNGGTLTVDRVSKEPIRVENTNVNILGGLQPKRLKELASNGRSNDGFMSRILSVYPSNSKAILFTGKTIDKIHQDNYDRLIQNLYTTSKKTITITDKHVSLYKKWQHQMAEKCFNDDAETAIQAKLETYVWRLALIIKMIEQASTNILKTELSDSNMEKAIRLIEYFRINALRVYDEVISTDPLKGLPLNKVELFKALPNKFKRHDVLPLFKDKGIKGGSINRFLNNKYLFIRLDSKGNYKKKFA